MSDDKSRARLGRGLASLIGGGGTAGVSGPRAALPFGPREGEGGGGERKVAVHRLAPNPRNPRRTFHAADLDELTASIRVHGVVQPILVRRRAGEAMGFEIVAGERRWRAAKAAGLSEVPVVLREISDRESLEIAIIENVQRADLDPIEEALGYQALIDEHDYTQNDLAEVLGKSRSHVANTLRLLKLPEPVRALVSQGALSAGAARTAVTMDDPEAFAQRIVDAGMSVREAEEAARETRPAPSPVSSSQPKRSLASKDEDTLALERLLSQVLEMPVSIDLAKKGGKLTLSFGNLEQLDELCRLLQERITAPGPRIRTL